jgi:ferredoxin
MKVLVNTKACSGHARCVAVAPDVFVLNSDGYNETAEATVRPGCEAQARRALRACPERAISLVEDVAPASQS